MHGGCEVLDAPAVAGVLREHGQCCEAVEADPPTHVLQAADDSSKREVFRLFVLVFRRWLGNVASWGRHRARVRGQVLRKARSDVCEQLAAVHADGAIGVVLDFEAEESGHDLVESDREMLFDQGSKQSLII